MNRLFYYFIIFICIFSVSLGHSQSSKSSNDIIHGDWSGVLKFETSFITLILHVDETEDNKTLATLDSPDQGVFGIAVDKFNFKDSSLVLEMNTIEARFEGKLNPISNEIHGTFTQRGVSRPLVFMKGIHLTKRPQNPSLPYPYIVEEVSYENANAGIKLSGTLTLPFSSKNSPAVVLITGSGPHDRDETIYGHKPFHVLADYLTRHGIAVLRFDDRGVGKSQGVFDEATTKDFASDVLAGVNYLKKRKEVNSGQIGLIGHSEGGMIAPMLAVDANHLAFIILMAAPGVSGEEILYEQQKLILKSHQISDSEITKNRKLQESLYKVLKSESNQAKAEVQLQNLFANHYSAPSEELPSEILESIRIMNSMWYRNFLTHDSASFLRQVQIPVLALNGELDLQVSSKQNLPAIEKILKKSGNIDYELVEFPKLNHLFQTSRTGAISEYIEIEETIAPIVLEKIVDWILARTRS